MIVARGSMFVARQALRGEHVRGALQPAPPRSYEFPPTAVPQEHGPEPLRCGDAGMGSTSCPAITPAVENGISLAASPATQDSGSRDIGIEDPSSPAGTTERP